MRGGRWLDYVDLGAAQYSLLGLQLLELDVDDWMMNLSYADAPPTSDVGTAIEN